MAATITGMLLTNASGMMLSTADTAMITIGSSDWGESQVRYFEAGSWLSRAIPYMVRVMAARVAIEVLATATAAAVRNSFSPKSPNSECSVLGIRSGLAMAAGTLGTDRIN